MQVTEFLPQAHQFVLVTFMLPAQHLRQQGHRGVYFTVRRDGHRGSCSSTSVNASGTKTQRAGPVIVAF